MYCYLLNLNEILKQLSSAANKGYLES